MLKCPNCQSDLRREGRSWKCRNGHSFDQARQGYVNLSHKQKSGGDNKLMVQARTKFLESGAYDFLRKKLCRILEEIHPHVLIDLGCGQGYYTSAFAKTADDSYGIDLSKDAISHAAKCDPKTQYIVGSIFSLPFGDQSADALVSVFTPLPVKEALRVLKPGGVFITASPGRMHHFELKEALYENVRLNEPAPTLEGFELVQEEELSDRIHVEDPFALLEMTPYRYKCPHSSVEKVQNMKDGLDVTFDFVIRVWRKP